MVHPFNFLLLVKVNLHSLKTDNLLAMAMYVLAVTPLINLLRQHQPDVSHVWFADDATVPG